MDKSLQTALRELTARQVITATLLIVAVSVAFWLLITFHVALILLVISIFLGERDTSSRRWVVPQGPASPLG